MKSLSRQRELSHFERGDATLSNFIVGYFFFQALNLFVKMILGGIPGWGLLSKGVLSVLLILAAAVLARRIVAISLVCEAIAFIAFAVTLLYGTAEISSLIEIMLNALCIFLPLGLCVYGMRNFDILLKKTYRCAWIIQPILLIVAVFYQDVSGATYSMSVGYSLLFQLLIVLDHFIETHKWYDLAAVVVDFIVIVVWGSRGPILCVAAFIVIKALFSKVSFKRKLFIVISIALCAIMLSIFYIQIAGYILNIAESFGFYSRTLNMLVKYGNISKSASRDLIFQQYWHLIKERPLLGWGIAGGWQYSSYPHNIILEFLLSFGIPIGSILCVCLAFSGFIGMRQEDISSRNLAHILVAFCLSLLVSGSFIKDSTFFMCVAICVKGKSELPP